MTEETYWPLADGLKGRLYRTAYLYLGGESAALDAVDEAVYKGFRACGKLRQPEFFATWLTRILINVCNMELRRRRRLAPLECVTGQSAEDYDSLPLREAIAKLSPELRAVVTLRYFTGLTLAECAQILELPQGTVATRQRRALQLLRLELEVDV